MSTVWNCPPAGFGGGWGPPRSPLPGVSVSLCVSVSLTLLSQSCPCVSVFAKLPHFGARLLRGGGRSRFPRLLDSKGLFSPACPTSPPTPPGCALLTALASVPPHTSTNTFASTLSVGVLRCGDPWCGKCGSELSLSTEFGPRKLKSKETWLMACDLNLWMQVVGDGRAGLRFQVSGACLGFGQEL